MSETVNLIQNIFLSIAKRFGLELQRKDAENDEYCRGLSLTAVIAHRVATLTMQDSSFSVAGSSARAQYMDSVLQTFASGQMDTVAEVSLGVGDCLVKPYTDGEHIGFNIIPSGDFVICDSIGDYIKCCIIKTGQIKGNDGAIYERYEVQRLIDTGLEIQTLAYRDGVEVSLNSIPAWESIPPTQTIPNVSGLLFGRYKCPTINRKNLNSPNGVCITHGLDSVIYEALEAYRRFNREVSSKESFIFADKTLFKPDVNGNPTLPKGKENIFLKVHNVNSESLIKEYSPNIRAAEMQSAIDVNFRMLELMSGLSNGILTPPSTSFATATEMKAALMATFAFMTRFRRLIDRGNRELLYAIEVIANCNRLSPVGVWEYSSDWSTGYLEQITEQYNRLLTSQGIGAVSVAEVRAYVMDEDLQTAEQAVQRISEGVSDEFA